MSKMRYVIVSVVHGEGGDFNNNLRKEVFKKFKVKSSKLPAHFTIKAPFEVEDDIFDLEKILENFVSREVAAPYELKGYNHFDERVIYMDVNMSKEGKELHDKLIEELSKLSYIDFEKKDGKDKVFHVTISSKKIKSVYNSLWEYVNEYPCNYNCMFDNISLFKWQDNTWRLHKEYYFNNNSTI